MYLDHLTERAQQAHNWTSFNPERIGKRIIEDYNAQLSADIEELQTAGIDPEVIEGYKTRYIALFSSWISAKSRCASSVITGGANFNVRRAEKANRSEENHYQLWQVWREKAKKAITRKAKEPKTYVSEIDRYRAELAAMQKNHELMKQGNKEIAKAIKEGRDISAYLMQTFGIEPHMIDWHMKFGFGLQNNSANMRRVQERIEMLEKKEQQRQESPEKEIQIEGGKIVFNYEIDRLQILFDAMPSADMREKLKRSGYKWSPKNSAWQRQLTPNAIWTTKRLFNLNQSTAQ